MGNFRKTPAHAEKSFTGMDRCILKVGTMLQLLSIFSLDVELRTIFKALFANQQFTIDEMHNYRMAVTEREVVHIYDMHSSY